MSATTARDGAALGCIFCRRGDGGFKSQEHVFPESLGNKDVVLPRGVVCDRCNHGVCSKLDAALLGFGPIELMRVAHAVPSKRGKLPTYKFDNGAFEATGPSALSVQLDSPKWLSQGVRREDGGTPWSFTSQRQDGTPKRLALVHRALVKMALECVWLRDGEDLAVAERFDRERDIVLRGGHHGFISMPKKGLPSTEFSLEYQPASRAEDGSPFLIIETSVLGIVMFTDTLLHTPPEMLQPGYLAAEF